MSKKILAIILSAVLLFACAVPAFAEDDAQQTGTLKIVNCNADGLPIPAFATPENRDPLECTSLLCDRLNELNADIIGVQEDFNFHSVLKRKIDLPYKTLHQGGIPFGDGMNFFARFPMYNVVHEAWESSYGVLDSSSDQLTPKGFMCASMEIADGVYIDVYDIHADADDGEKDIAARVSEFQQLLRYVDTYSKDHAVIILGDTNARFQQLESRLNELFIEGEGFKDVWIELENEGRYTLTDEDIARFNARYSSWWGVWDSAEKVFYRDGGGVSFEALSHEYKWYYSDEGVQLADHAAQIVELNYSIDNSAVQDTRTYNEETFDLANWLTLHVKYFFKSLFLILGALPGLIIEKIGL